jgi:DNA polymerase-1
VAHIGVKLKLNLRTPDDGESKQRVAEAVKAKKAANETIEEAWQRILAMKNGESDRQRLIEVKNAMESGALGRHPADVAKRFSKAEAMRLWSHLQEHSKADKLRELVEKTPENYRLITDKDALDHVIRKIKADPGKLIAVDTETTGLDVYSDIIVGISLSVPCYDLHVYIPVGHDDCEQLERDYVLEKLRPILEDESIGKVLHNSKYDIHMFLRHGIRLRGLAWDTVVAMHLLNENEESFALKNLATKYLNEPSDTYSALFGRAQFNTIPLDVALVYAAKDTDLTWRLYQFQLSHLKNLPKILDLYEKVENPLIDVVVDMERTGFIIDTDYATTVGEKLSTDIAELDANLKIYFGDVNLNSPVQLKPAIESLIGKKIDSTDAKKVLKPLATDYEEIETLLKYKELVKLYGTYIDALPQQVKSDGRIHGSFNQAATVTGRFASREPNLQNQPKYARKLFVAPPGMVILSGDFSQQEPRLLAHFSGEEILIESYRAGKDLYTSAAAELFGLPESECGDGSKYRKMLKIGILAVMYGTGPKTLAGQLGISEKEASEFIEQFYDKYPKVKSWIDSNEAFAKKYGFVEMLMGRKRRLPGVKSKDRSEQFRALRQATNAIIQGSAAIQTKLTMIDLDKLCKRKGWNLAFTIHDECAAYVPESITIDEVKEFESVMLNTVKLAVPNKSDIELSRRWGEGLSVNQWFNGRS